MSKEQLKSLYESLDFLNSLRESNDIKIWSRMLEKTAAALDAETGLYYYFDTLARQLVPFYAVGLDLKPAECKPVAIGQGLCGWVAKFREAVAVKDVPQDERYSEVVDSVPGTKSRSILCVPCFVDFDFVGVFEFFNKSGGQFTDADVKFAQTITQWTSHSIRRLRLEDSVSRVTAYNASILDNMSGGFLAVDLQGRVMICNPAARRLLDVHGEPVDRPVEEVLGACIEMASVLRSTIATKQTLKRKELTWSLRGEKRVLGYSTLLIRDTQGVFAGAGVTFQDITHIKK